jgi:hypothetical protein
VVLKEFGAIVDDEAIWPTRLGYPTAFVVLE